MMGECDAILRSGVFESLSIDASRSTSENLASWLKSLEWSQLKKKRDAGLKIGLPIKGVPLEIGGDYGQDDFEEWKEQVNKGQVRDFTDEEALQIVEANASEVIVNGWLGCLALQAGAAGLTGTLEVAGDPSTLIFRARFSPNSVTDYPPKIKDRGFQLVGARTDYPLQAGDTVPFGGISVLLRRIDREGVSVVLNTDKGDIEASVPPLNLEPVVPGNIWLVVDRSDEYPTHNLRLDGRSEALDAVDHVTYEISAVFDKIRPTLTDLQREGDSRAHGFSYPYSTVPRPHLPPGAVWPYKELRGVKAVAHLKDGRTWTYAWLP